MIDNIIYQFKNADDKGTLLRAEAPKINSIRARRMHFLYWPAQSQQKELILTFCCPNHAVNDLKNSHVLVCTVSISLRM